MLMLDAVSIPELGSGNSPIIVSGGFHVLLLGRVFRLQLTIPLPATTVQLPCIPLYPAHEPQNNKERSANSCENRYRPKDSHHLDVESMQMGCGVLATNGSHGGRRRRFGEAEHLATVRCWTLRLLELVASFVPLAHFVAFFSGFFTSQA